ncbi:MAG: class I SAM-dependent methyltransferase [Clostridia bacterium]|nr:class I SAM-dependent methyltransferase [Clostridia bacterium]
MNDQYYTADPQSESKPVVCEFTWRGHDMKFTTDAGVFSKGELDYGTRTLLDALPEQMTGDILDIGCGWGPIGICVKKHWPETRVMMGDVNRRALRLTAENAAVNGADITCRESDGMAAFMDSRFDAVITNPPIRAGKQTIYRIFADSAMCLKEDGALYLVIRKQQGADSCMKYLKTIFADVEILDRSGGFRVLRASGRIIGEE